jgi:hypothetical protein
LSQRARNSIDIDSNLESQSQQKNRWELEHGNGVSPQTPIYTLALPFVKGIMLAIVRYFSQACELLTSAKFLEHPTATEQMSEGAKAHSDLLSAGRSIQMLNIFTVNRSVFS